MGLQIDPELIKRYSGPGPRYTSYPTAPHFSPSFTGASLLEEIRRTNAEPGNRPLSLYAHLPFCRSLCWYCGCNMMVTHRPEKIEQYLGYLAREIDTVAREIHPEREVVQLHWGGGTPTYLDAGQIGRLMDHLRHSFRFADDAELSLEADPRELTRDRLESARRSGFNRISMGVQDFNPKVQASIGRIQPFELVRDLLIGVRELAFEGVSFDLIYGLPHQSLQSFEHTLDQVIELGPDRLSLFNYAHLPHLKRHQRLIDDTALPLPEEKTAILIRAIEKLTTDGGYRFVGMDHFARPDDSLCRAQDEGTLYRNFQGYSTHAGADLYAFGVSAITQLEWIYAQHTKDLQSYYRALDAGRLPTHVGLRLTEEDRLRRHIIMRLMCDFKLDPEAVALQFGMDFEAHFREALERLVPMERDGLVEWRGSVLHITDTGRLLVRNVAMAFDAYLGEDRTSRVPMYSQTI